MHTGGRVLLLGEYMRAQRKAAVGPDGKKWSGASLARSIGVTRATVSNWECGERLPSLVVLRDWADALQLSRRQYLVAVDLLERDQRTQTSAA